MERVTTPVDMNILEMDGPLDPAFTRPSSQKVEELDLDMQPMKGPRETGNVTTDLLDQYIDENYADVLRTSVLNPSSYLSLPSGKTPPHHTQQRLLAMDWYVPDGSNRRIVEIQQKEIANFHSPGGGTGALILTLTRLLLYYNTTRYLVDIDSGEVFGWVANQWRRTGLYCSSQPFVIGELMAMTTRCSAALQMDMEQEQQTSVIQLAGGQRTNVTSPPPLPLLPETDVYIQHGDAMSLNMRRNYVRDRTQAALTYISEYDATQKWEGDSQYDQQQVRQRLQIVFGKANQVRERIDTALNNDDIHRRRRMMCLLELPTRFPQPQNMKDSPVTTWITWIREESNKLIAAIDDEITKRQDPDDPFDGTASGIFPPLQQRNTAPPQRCVQQVDESKDRNSQAKESAEGRLIEVQNPGAQSNCHRTAEMGEPEVTIQPDIQQSGREKDVIDSSTNRQGVRPTHKEGDILSGQLPAQTTQRRIEQLHTSSTLQEQKAEDPFRTLRSFHEKQRGERQQNDTHQTSITLHSMFEGAVGGVRTDHPKPQRITKKHQQQDQPRTMQSQENYPRQDNQLQGLHNTTTYMTLPNSVQNKICGRCGVMGHIKRMCQEEVYCRYCRVYTRAAAACRTYPVTSSRKNTPEKRTVEDIEREVSRRVQEEMRRILNDFSTSRRVASTQRIQQRNQSSERKDATNQTRGQHVQNLIGDFQRPPEVFERTIGNSNRTKEIDDQILNQQWDEPLHMQPPMVPTAAPTPQSQYTTTNTTNRKVKVPTEGHFQPNLPKEGWGTRAEGTSTFATNQQVESQQENPQGSQFFSRQGNVSTPTGHRPSEQFNGKECPGCSKSAKETLDQVNQPTQKEREKPIINEIQGGGESTGGEKKGPPECKVIRVLPDEDLDFMDLVRDSVSAQAKNALKPMFVNNYFVGDNNWRTTTGDRPHQVRLSDESKNRSSIAVQTAVSLLGEENKPARLVQTDISRMKAMSNNEGVYDTQSPLVVEPTKNGNSTGWSTNSFNLPEVHQNTSIRQQCKGLPDLTVPPPPIQDNTLPQGQGETNSGNAILRVIERMTDTMEQQMKLSVTRSEYNMQQNTKVMDQFIKAQDRRDLDPALMDIPTFTGEEPERCLEWITCIRNVCRQSGRSFQQELTNKSRLVVQNFLSTLEGDLAENDLVEKLLQMFSDIPTTTQAIIKLKAMRQSDNETILTYNQRYKTLVKRVEGQPIECITSPVAMEMYLGTIIPPLRKSIKNSLFWNSKHAPKTVGEAMVKAQQLYVKHLYSTGEERDEDQKKPVEDVVINEISRKFENRYRDRKNDFRDSSNNRRTSFDSGHRRWQTQDDRKSLDESFSKHYVSPDKQITHTRFDTTTSHRETASEAPPHQRQDMGRQDQPNSSIDDSTRQQNCRDNQTSVLRGGYTQILVNPVQLTDAEFTNWMEKLVEVRKNRQERKPRPYRNYRKSYNDDQSEFKKPQLRNKLHSAQELDVQSIMTSFNCEYDDVVEAVDLYNMDVEESQSA